MLIARRVILAALAVGSLAPLLGVRRLLFGSPLPAPAAASPLAGRLAGLLAARDSAAVLGRAYLEGASEEAAADRLVALILPGRREGDLAGAEDSRLRALVGERHRSDFANGRTVVLRGWILSCTEARLYALAALAA